MGMPFLTGFYSKDVILEVGYATYSTASHFAYWLGSFAAFCTAFYSIRLLALCFLVEPNGSRSLLLSASEGSWAITDTLSRKVKSSCSLRVPNYKNEFNERENIYTRGLLLGKFFGSKVVSLGYIFFLIYFTGSNKGRSGVVRSLSKTGIEIYSTVLITHRTYNVGTTYSE